jgi:transmembrane sensor
MSERVDKQLIEKFLLGKCTADEEKQVRLFLKKPESEILLNEILSARENQDLALFEEPEKDDSKKQQWNNTINNRITAASLPKKQPLTILFSLKHAAVWICILAAAVSIYALNLLGPSEAKTISYAISSNPNGQRSRITLSDNSIVYLGAGSRLRYPKQFTGNKREIELYGEAFFEVTKNPKRPFIIHTGKVQTKVLGTSFKIEAFKDDALTVKVATGKVRVDQYQGQKMKSLAVLLPGQQVTYFHHLATTGLVDAKEVTALKNSLLIFHNSSLLEISAILQRWYNKKITFNVPAKGMERMTVTLDASVSIDKLLNALGAAGNFKYTIEKNEIIIRNKSKQERKIPWTR